MFEKVTEDTNQILCMRPFERRNGLEGVRGNVKRGIDFFPVAVPYIVSDFLQ